MDIAGRLCHCCGGVLGAEQRFCAGCGWPVYGGPGSYRSVSARFLWAAAAYYVILYSVPLVLLSFVAVPLLLWLWFLWWVNRPRGSDSSFSAYCRWLSG